MKTENCLVLEISLPVLNLYSWQSYLTNSIIFTFHNFCKIRIICHCILFYLVNKNILNEKKWQNSYIVVPIMHESPIAFDLLMPLLENVQKCVLNTYLYELFDEAGICLYSNLYNHIYHNCICNINKNIKFIYYIFTWKCIITQTGPRKIYVILITMTTNMYR